MTGKKSVTGMYEAENMPYDPLTVWEWEGGAIVPDHEANLDDVAGFERSEPGDQNDETRDARAASRGRPAEALSDPRAIRRPGAE
jgi:hypothetical protein